MLRQSRASLLRAESAEVERMLSGLSPKSITARFSLEAKRQQLQDELSQLEGEPNTTAVVRLLFMGVPVRGTLAIDAAFASNALCAYQELIAKAVTSRNGARKRKKKGAAVINKAPFYLTGVARGSFGFVLEENKDANPQLSLVDTALKLVVNDVSEKMVVFGDLDEEPYTQLVGELTKPVFLAIRKFFGILHKYQAELKIEEDDQRVVFTGAQIALAHERAEATSIDESTSEVVGMLQGLSPYGNTFDFLSHNQTQYTGKLDPAFARVYRSQVEAEEFYTLGKTFRAKITKRTTQRNNGVQYVGHYLLSLSELSPPSNAATDLGI